jgi:hypothetical protein
MNAATITGLSFPTTAKTFNVYRGLTPQLLYRVATVALAQASATSSGYSFTDTGAATQPIGPPDANFDHANFYYRGQYTSPFLATISGTNTIGNPDMGNVPSVYANTGRVVRIMSGTGMGQERSIIANDQNLLTVNPSWSIVPNATSSFVVVDSSWKFAAVSMTNPVQFQIPYKAGANIQISGRAANVQNQEGTPDLCPMTVWTGAKPDASTPGTPTFTLNAPGGGNLTVSQISFQSLTNAATVSSATVSIFSWDEIQRPSTSLAGAVAANDNGISLTSGASLSLGQVLQVGEELMIVTGPMDSVTNLYPVDRNTLTTKSADHSSGEIVLALQQTSLVLPFERGFFENAALTNYLHTVSMPDCRVFAAQMFMTNVFGDGQTVTNSYLAAPLRTLSGGQFSLQVAGYLATQTNVAPALIVQKTHAVRDIWASMGQAAQGYSIAVDILQNGAAYCSFVIPPQGAGAANGTVDETKAALYVDGASIPPLQEGATLTMNVTLQASGTTTSLNPGKDLSVTVRF